MTPLRSTLEDRRTFACGVELVTTRGTMDESRAVHTQSLARVARAFLARDVARFQSLARHQADLGADAWTLMIDPGLAPVSADTCGLVNRGLNAIKRIHSEPDLQGIHIPVGLNNFLFGLPDAGFRQSDTMIELFSEADL